MKSINIYQYCKENRTTIEDQLKDKYFEVYSHSLSKLKGQYWRKVISGIGYRALSSQENEECIKTVENWLQNPQDYTTFKSLLKHSTEKNITLNEVSTYLELV